VALLDLWRRLWRRAPDKLPKGTLTSGAPITTAKPLWEQFQRIGGGITPLDVSWIIRSADAGQPARLVDLANESRQKDCHLQSVLYTRESAPALIELEFILPDDATAKEKEAADLCRQLKDNFKNLPTMIEHLNGAFFGHATVEILPWQKTRNGYLLPNECKPLHQRDFLFTQDTGALRYAESPGDSIGVDLLALNPGRIVQVQRRIVGDVQVREGLARLLVWAALFRNWTLRDWIALGEVGWKPRMWAQYGDWTNTDDQVKLLRALESIAERGIGVFPKDTEVEAQWPGGAASGSGGGVHRELFDTIGREMSKAVLGQTTSIEVGPNGSRADTAARDVVRTDICETDCRAIAAALRYQLFAPAVALNIGTDIRMPVPWFATDDAADQLKFAQAIQALDATGLKIGAPWVRETLGMPEPKEDEELVGGQEGPVDKGTVGAQTTALIELIAEVNAGRMPRETAVSILGTVFGLSPEEADALLGTVGKGFKPTPEPVPPSPFGPPKPPEPAPTAEGEGEGDEPNADPTEEPATEPADEAA
jgi:phage gp29-like protein